jgi:hypothetical protein
VSTIKSSAENLTLNADGANNDIKFQSNGVEKASIDQDGVITATGATITSSGTNVGGVIEITANSLTSGRVLNVVSNGMTTGNLANFYSNTADTGTRDLVKITNDNTAATGTTALKVTQDSTGLCADFVGDKIRAADGILFGTDTAAANALDDYEEGTWTPTTAAGWASTTLDGTGSYTKIGNIVHVMLQTHVDGSGAGSGHISIGGLPFTSSSTADYRAAISFFAYNLASSVNTYITGFVEVNDTIMQIYEGGLSSVGNDMGAHFDTGSSFYLQATYRV